MLTRIRVLSGIVILGLVASGISALPLQIESGFLCEFLQRSGSFPALAAFMRQINNGLAALRWSSGYFSGKTFFTSRLIPSWANSLAG